MRKRPWLLFHVLNGLAEPADTCIFNFITRFKNKLVVRGFDQLNNYFQNVLCSVAFLTSCSKIALGERQNDHLS